MQAVLVWVAKWLIQTFLGDLIAEYFWQIVTTVVMGIVCLVLTVAWSISVMGQPGGIYWLAAQAPPEIRAQHPPLVPIPVPGPLNPGPGDVTVPPPVPLPVGPILPRGQWVDGPAYNQFAAGNWRTTSNFNIWAPAACSAASLAWLLRAYGRPVAYLDDAVALMNPPYGISSALGLMDHTGTQVAASLAHQGLSGFKKHFNSTAELVEGLRSGPLAMDGQRWFGVGHWFVATGSDAGGITVRESSGHDVRYLTWQQLYGTVGWSGWAVGVLP